MKKNTRPLILYIYIYECKQLQGLWLTENAISLQFFVHITSDFVNILNQFLSSRVEN